MPSVPLPPQTQKGRSNPIQNTHIPPLPVESNPLSNVRHLNHNEQQNDLPLQTDSSQVTSTHEKKQIIIKRKNISKPQNTNLTNSQENLKTHTDDLRSPNKEVGSKRQITSDCSNSTKGKTKKMKISLMGNSPNERVGLQQIDLFAPKAKSLVEKRARSSFTKEGKCEFCNATFVNQKSLKYHLISNHYMSKTIKRISPDSPYNCPQCNEKFEPPDTARQFTKHYYHCHFDNHTKKDQSISGNETPSSIPKSSNSSNKNYSNDHQCKAELSKKHNIQISTAQDTMESPSDSSGADSEVLPPSRTRRTIHTPTSHLKTITNHVSDSDRTHVSSARQRMRDNWQKTSIDCQNYEIESLHKRIQEMETSHSQQMREKAEGFEKWIMQKESSLESEKNARKDVEQSLEESQVNIVGLKKQLEQQQLSYKNLEVMLAEKHAANHQLSQEKKDMEKSLAKTKEELDDSNQILLTRNEEIQNIQKKVIDQINQMSDMESSMSAKDDEIKDLNKNKDWLKNDYEKKLTRIQKQLDFSKNKISKLTEEKRMKVKEIKEANLEIKRKDERIINLTKENNEFVLEITKQKSMVDQPAHALEKISLKGEMISSSSHGDESNVNSKQCEEHEKEKKSLLDHLERLQKLMEGHITVIEDKNKTIAELNSKCEDSENNLDQALQKLNELKDSDKQKKDAQKQLKQLQTTLKEWESRQYTNLNLISGLQEKNEQLKMQIKDYEENNTGSEEKMYDHVSKAKKLEIECKNIREKSEQSEKSLAETESRLKVRDGEVVDLKFQIEKLEAKILDLERALRRVPNMPQAEVQQLLLEIENKDGEVKHLRKALDNLKYQAKLASDCHNEELDESKKTSHQFEMKYSKASQKVEEFRKILHDAEKSILYKDNQLSCYKHVVNEENVNMLKTLIHESRTHHQIERATKVIQDLSDALTNVNSGVCYNLNEQSYLVKSEPIDEGEELSNSCHVSTHNVTNKNLPSEKASQSPIKPVSSVNTEKQIILNVPTITDMVVSDSFTSPEFKYSAPRVKAHELATVKQEQEAEKHTTSSSSQDFNNAIITKCGVGQVSMKMTSHLNLSTAPSYTASTNSKESSSLANAIQDIKYSVPQTSVQTTHSHSLQGLSKSPLLSTQQPLPSQNSTVTQHDELNENYLVVAASSANATDSEESDTCLDDFFPQTDPLSGLSFAPKLEEKLPLVPKSMQYSKTKPSTSITDFRKTSRTQLEDFTGKYAADEEESYACGICNHHDPPPEISNNQSVTRYTTEWVGCDCERWFHKPCTKMKKFMKSFSCKSVKMKCLPKANSASPSSANQIAVGNSKPK